MKRRLRLIATALLSVLILNSALQTVIQYSGLSLRTKLIVMWGLQIPLGIIVLIFLAKALTKMKRVNENRCIACGYDLRASGERCSECGTGRNSSN